VLPHGLVLRCKEVKQNIVLFSSEYRDQHYLSIQNNNGVVGWNATSVTKTKTVVNMVKYCQLKVKNTDFAVLLPLRLHSKGYEHCNISILLLCQMMGPINPGIACNCMRV
jgi:hypothetical protein